MLIADNFSWIGRCHIPLDICRCPCSFVIRSFCRIAFLLLGVERREIAHRSQYVPVQFLFRKTLKCLDSVYIFKHVTVIGVYITMFAK